MKFTINDLKVRGPLGHKQFKKVYDWDYFKYIKTDDGEFVFVYRNNEEIRSFTLAEFALLVAGTNCIDDWYEVPNSINDKVFTALDIAYMIDVMQEYKRSLYPDKKEDFEATITYCKNQLKKHGYEYYWPELHEQFSSDLHYAIGLVQDPVYKTGEIVRVQNGGIKNIVTGKFYKFPKIYIAR